MPIQTILMGVVPPLLVAAAFLLAAWRPWQRVESIKGHWGSALAIGISYAAAEALIMHGVPRLPPLDSQRWLFFIAPVLAIFIAADPFRRARSVEGYALAAAAACFVPLMWRDLSRTGTLPIALLHLLAYTLVAAMIWREGTAAGRAGTGVRVPLVWLIAAACAAVAFRQTPESYFAQMAGALAVVMGVFLALAAWRPDLGLMRGAAPVFAVLLTALVLCIPTTLWTALLVLASAAMPGLANTAMLRGKPNGQVTAACALAAAALGVAAIWQSPCGFDFSRY